MVEQRERREWLVAGILITCLVVVAFWEGMAIWSRRPWEPFSLTAADFDDFVPASEQWEIRRVPVSVDPVEPNILAYAMMPRSGGTPPVLVRLVHGYNMRDCMRIKGYEVELIGGMGDEGGRRRAEGGKGEGRKEDNLVQVWRLTSETGQVAVWITSLLRATDFEPVEKDVRSLPFPRIGVPDDPRWLPEGITLRSLRHPVTSFRHFLRAKWNSSRCDPWVFLGLKQAPWASEEVLTLVSAAKQVQSDSRTDNQVIADTLVIHRFMEKALKDYWRQESEGQEEKAVRL